MRAVRAPRSRGIKGGRMMCCEGTAMMIGNLYYVFLILCEWCSSVIGKLAAIYRTVRFWAAGGSVRTCARGSRDTSRRLYAYDFLDPRADVVKTLTRGDEVPKLDDLLAEDSRLRSRVLMATMFLRDDATSCPKTQTFLHPRLKGIANTAPTARELARLSETACGLEPRALKDTLVVIYDDFEEKVFSRDEVVAL